MSADNLIYVKLMDGLWHVWHDFASNDEPIPRGYDHRVFADKHDALDYAFELEKDIGYVEYGVSLIDDEQEDNDE